MRDFSRSRESRGAKLAQRKTPGLAGASLKSNKQYAGRAPVHYSPPKKLPPYGKPLIQKFRRGEKPANVVWVACGLKAWERVKEDLKRTDSWATCLPYGEDPTAYHWPVTGLDCLVIHTGGLDAGTLRTLSAELIQSGARRAVVLDTLAVLAEGPVVFKGVSHE